MWVDVFESIEQKYKLRVEKTQKQQNMESKAGEIVTKEVHDSYKLANQDR